MIVAYGEAVFAASVIVSGLYAAYAICFEVVEAYRHRQAQRTT